MTAAGRCAGPKTRKEAASPPLTFRGAAALRPGARRARVRGRPSGLKGCCAPPSLPAQASRPALTPETSAAPRAGKAAGPGLPRPGRGAPVPAVAAAAPGRQGMK